MKAKLLVTTLITLAANAGQALPYQKYLCKDPTSGQTLFQAGVSSHCAGTTDMCGYVLYNKFILAEGTYKYHQGTCPSRLCGSVDLQIEAKAKPTRVLPFTETVTVHLHDSGTLVVGDFQILKQGESTPKAVTVTCEQVP